MKIRRRGRKLKGKYHRKKIREKIKEKGIIPHAIQEKLPDELCELK